MGSLFGSGGGGSASAPTPPPPPPAPLEAIPPTMANPGVKAAGANQVARAAAGLSGGTRKARGDLSSPPTTSATLLGQG